MDRRTLEIIALDADVETWRRRAKEKTAQDAVSSTSSVPCSRVEGILTDGGDNHTGSLLSILTGEGGVGGRSEKTVPDAV